jgi:hypothetical protein
MGRALAKPINSRRDVDVPRRRDEVMGIAALHPSYGLICSSEPCMSDDDHDPNMYPRSMEIVGRVVLIVVGTIVGTLLLLAQILMLLPSPQP